MLPLERKLKHYMSIILTFSNPLLFRMEAKTYKELGITFGTNCKIIKSFQKFSIQIEIYLSIQGCSSKIVFGPTVMKAVVAIPSVATAIESLTSLVPCALVPLKVLFLYEC